MKKKKNPIVISIIILLLILLVIIFLYISPNNLEDNNFFNDESSENVSEVKANIQTIENTLSSSGEISSALSEKIYLHTSYYFEKLLVEENVYIEAGTNIIQYTNDTYLTAPYDCVITASNLPAEGEICTTSRYIEISSIESLSMNLSVSETDINKIEIGDMVDINITATDEKVQGYITSISEVGTYNSNGSYFSATVTFDNNGNLKIGMSATCEIIIERAENVVAVPVEAIQTSDEGKYVIVVNSDGSTSNVSVETGISNDAYTEIKSGISEGTTVQMTESSENSKNGFNMNFNGNAPGGREMTSNFENPASGGKMPNLSEMPETNR